MSLPKRCCAEISNPEISRINNHPLLDPAVLHPNSIWIAALKCRSLLAPRSALPSLGSNKGPSLRSVVQFPRCARDDSRSVVKNEYGFDTALEINVPAPSGHHPLTDKAN